ncbi:MAG: Signal transduction histidine kinase [Candidatus Electronema aureum]|uniref:histidine kinase n=1 Tax=Candidatus Electronema aureum TaxID=2005002 RepID=A0A521G0J5_9BACT|nr:MAG: Signal transduction histidine kinase [Candidatus Electronema aureum]
MTNFLLRAIGLKKRIVFGYVITGAMAFMIALLSYGAFTRLSADFRKIVLFSRRSADNMVFAAQMAEMQRQALIYIYEGHSSSGSQVGVIYQKMMQNIGGSEAIEQLGAKAVVTLAKKHLEAYYEAFQEVRRQRQLQARLVKSEFRVHATRGQQLIEELIREEGETRLLECTKMLNALLQIEKNAYRYLDSFDGDFIKAALFNIQETRSLIGHFQQNHQTIELNNVLNSYESSFLEAVQRTRGYLYLTSVVMAAQAYETMYQSKKLSALMISESERIQQQLFQHVSSRLRLLLFWTVFLLLFIALFSYVITKSITIPLKRLTKTFKLLASGSADAEIPSYPLQDELGDLTNAAASFKEKNIALRTSKQELERSNDELEQFVYTVSHDLKSPIVTSMGFIGIIRKLASQGKAEQAMGMLDKVVKANERMSQLINDLLELSRVGRIDMDKKQIDLNQLLGDFAHNQSERLKAAKFTLTVEQDLPVIYANESRTLQVFENILSNGLKYVRNEKEGGRLRISSFEDKQWHHIRCTDNGLGIPEEYREKIFGLFYRLDVNIEGTGIGLAVAKKIMKFHNGDIRAEAGPNGGAVFHLTFPKMMDL